MCGLSSDQVVGNCVEKHQRRSIDIESMVDGPSRDRALLGALLSSGTDLLCQVDRFHTDCTVKLVPAGALGQANSARELSARSRDASRDRPV